MYSTIILQLSRVILFKRCSITKSIVPAATVSNLRSKLESLWATTAFLADICCCRHFMISKVDRLREYNVQCQSILLHNNVQTHILSVEVYDDFLQVMWTIPY